LDLAGSSGLVKTKEILQDFDKFQTFMIDPPKFKELDPEIVGISAKAIKLLTSSLPPDLLEAQGTSA
jgi:hypothetical protein